MLVWPLVGVRIVVAGAGFAGLATALALKNSGHEVVIVERDPEPPSLAPERAFDDWVRPGVPQFRHAHIFLGRLQSIVRDRHAELFAELRAAGIELSSLDEFLPESHLADFRPQPGDADLQNFWGRRATFEYVLRQHVGRLPHVRFLHGCKVDGLIAETNAGQLQIRGLTFTRGGARERIEGDWVVDASGKRTHAPQWLRALGVAVHALDVPSNYEYVCRHFQLEDPSAWPPRRGTGANLDYLWYGTFYAEHGRFAVAFACPTDERQLAKALASSDGFSGACRQLPVLAAWTERARAESKVLGAGRFENRWFRYGGTGGLALSGFVAVGDSHIETNPMYGRGCTSAFLQAHALAEALASDADQRAQARDYYARTRRLLQTQFDFCLQTDRMFANRAKLCRGEPIAFGGRFLKYAYEHAWIPAMQASLLVAREMIKAMQMREVSSLPLRLAMVYQILRAWLLDALHLARVPRLALGPAREDFLRKLLPDVPEPSPPPEPSGAAPEQASGAALEDAEQPA